MDEISECGLPGVKTFPGFLEPSVCQQLVTAFRAHPDLTARYEAENAQHFNGRVFFTSRLEEPLLDEVRRIERRIAPLVEEHLAGFPVSAYGDGDEPQLAWWPEPYGMPFHHDNDSGRLHTALVTLNDGFEGGGTSFQAHEVIVRPAMGDLLIFDGSLMHGAATVTSGERFTLIMWFHRSVNL